MLLDSFILPSFFCDYPQSSLYVLLPATCLSQPQPHTPMLFSRPQPRPSTLPSSNTTTAPPLAATYQTGMTTALTDTISLQASNGNLASILVLATDSSGAHHLHIVMAPVILDPHRVQAPHPSTACIGVTDDAAFTCSTSPSTTELINDLPL